MTITAMEMMFLIQASSLIVAILPCQTAKNQLDVNKNNIIIIINNKNNIYINNNRNDINNNNTDMKNNKETHIKKTTTKRLM